MTNLRRILKVLFVTIPLLVLIIPLLADKEAHVLFAGVTYIVEERCADHDIVGQERPVANHLGVFALPMGED